MLFNNTLSKLFFVFSALYGSAQAANQGSTAHVWQHHIDSWVARDLTAIASDYDESSVMIVNNVIYRGQDQIKGIFDRLFKVFDQGENKIDPAILEGRIIYITWNFTPHGDQSFPGTDTFVVENGVIKIQTIASPLYDSKHWVP